MTQGAWFLIWRLVQMTVAARAAISLHEEQKAKRTRGCRERRWMVEHIASWINRFRRIFIRCEKKAVNHEAMAHVAFAYVVWRRTKVLG